LFEAESAVAMFAVKVRVLILHSAIAIVGTYGVFECARPIVDGVNESVEQEKRKCSRDGAFVYSGQKTFQIGERNGFVASHHLANNKQAIGRGFDVAQC